MDELKKFGQVRKMAMGDSDMAKINAQALKELKPEDVFTFRIAACDDQVDRDHERFTVGCLHELAKLYVGRPVIMDHAWKACNQTARIYDAAVETEGGVNRLILYAYMLRNEATAPVVEAIEGGILREVSVGCATDKCTCSICGADKSTTWCRHVPGERYGEKLCVVELSEARDAYEVSFCAVPIQPGAGVTKCYGGEENKPLDPKPGDDPEIQRTLALLELEKNRF